MMDHSIAFTVLSVLALAVLAFIFGAKYWSAGRIARLDSRRDAEYRALAEKATAAATANASSLAAVQADIAEIKSTLATVSRLLKEVQ